MSTPLSKVGLVVNSAAQIASNILNTIKNGLIGIGGVPNPNVGPVSYFALMSQALGNECSSAENNAALMGQQGMPDSAIGVFLDNYLNQFNIPRRPASSASGFVVGTTSPLSASIFIPTGTQLQSNAGLLYQVQQGGFYGNNSSIPIISVSTGSDTNLEVGSTLQWIATPTYFTLQVTVSSALTGGVDAEDDDSARARLLAFYQAPPGGGNPSDLIEAAQKADPSVQTAFVYPAIRLGSTVDVTPVGYATANSSNRQLDVLILANKIAPQITASLPIGTDGYITAAENYPIDISILLSLPYPPNANPPGPGGGWIDATPLQVLPAQPAIRVVDGYAISGFDPTLLPYQNTATQFWVDFPVLPVPNSVYNISYLSPQTLTLSQAQTSGSYVYYSNIAGAPGSHPTLAYITINTPFYANATNATIIQPGHWIFPSAINTVIYVKAFLSYMASLGPGERTSTAGLLPRSKRFPSETQTWNYKLNSRVVKPIIESGPEVYDGLLFYNAEGQIGQYGTNNLVNGLPSDTTSWITYSSINFNSDPAYAQNAPPTSYNYFNTTVSPTFIFVTGNFGLYQLT